MIRLDLPLIGPAASILEAARTVAARRDRIALLFDGAPGVGKSHLADVLASEIAGNQFAVEQFNGQSLSVDVVRQWRDRAGYGNLFSTWTVKRVDEIDQASGSAVSELLSYLDYLPTGLAVIATTNEYGKLRAQSRGRLETRFLRFQVASPTVEDTASYIARQFRIPKAAAMEIAVGSVPDGCLASEGCNVRAAVEDAEALAVIRGIRKERAA